MTDETQPRRGRGTKLTVAALVAALAAFVVFAPFASGAADPVASGSTKITLNQALFKQLKKHHVKLSAVKPGKVKGKAITLPIKGTESSLDPTTGAGELVHKGGFKLTADKKHKVVIKNVVLNTTTKTLIGKVGKKRVKICAVSVVSLKRESFGADLLVKKLTVTKKAAKLLNKSLDENVFKANKSLGSASSTEQPQTVTVTGGSATLASDVSTVHTLNTVGVKIEVIPPTTGAKIPPLFTFPISGGSLAPDASAGIVQTSGGLKLVQKLPKNPAETEFLETTITLGGIWVDFAAKTSSVETILESNISSDLNTGNVGRASIANINMTGASIVADAGSHTITIQNASATLQPVSAEILNGFVKIWGAWLVPVLEGKGLSPQEAKEKAAAEVAANEIKAGAGLGTFGLTAQTQ